MTLSSLVIIRRSYVQAQELCHRRPCLLILFALEAMMSPGDGQQLDMPISFSKRFFHLQALFDWDLCVTVAVNQQDWSVDLVCNMDGRVMIAGSAH